MTLVEVLIAMVVIAIGVSGLVAGLGGGILAVQRSAKTSTAGALADQQMEGYRRIPFASIGTTDTTLALTDCIYKGTVGGACTFAYDSAYDSTWKVDSVAAAACTQNYCVPTRTVAGGGGVSYRIDSYVSWACGVSTSTLTAPVSPATVPTCSGSPASAPVKRVSVLVRDAGNKSKTFVRVTSTFNSLTG
jgi:type II secretory pathway pseudopilin PulG